MDQTKVKYVKTVDVADDLLKAESQVKQKENALSALDEWEMVLASGGEGAPNW